MQQSIPEGKKVAVILHNESGKVKLSVADEGNGIPIEDKKKYLKKFYRISSKPLKKQKAQGWVCI